MQDNFDLGKSLLGGFNSKKVISVIEALQTDSKDLKSEIKSLREENNALESELAALKREKAGLIQKNETLELEWQQLKIALSEALEALGSVKPFLD